MDEVDKAGFLERLRDATTAKGWSQNELSRQLGASPGTVTPWFREEGPSWPHGKYLLALPRILEVSPLWLFYDEGPRDADPLLEEVVERVRQFAAEIEKEYGARIKGEDGRAARLLAAKGVLKQADEAGSSTRPTPTGPRKRNTG